MKSRQGAPAWTCLRTIVGWGSLLGGILGSTVDGAAPDPGDAHLLRLPPLMASGHSSLNNTITAISGDGRTLVQECSSGFSFEGIPSYSQDLFLVVDDQRRLLSSYSGSGPNTDGPNESGPLWHVVGLTTDGGHGLGQRHQDRRVEVFAIRLTDNAPTIVAKGSPLPLTRALAISPSGAWAFGLWETPASLTLRRVSLLDGHAEDLVDSARVPGLEFVAATDDGSFVLGRGQLPEAADGWERAFAWRAGEGFRWLDLPRQVRVTGMDGQGHWIVGTHEGSDGAWTSWRPVIWSEREGLRELPIARADVAGFWGSVTAIAGDGSRVFGWVGAAKADGSSDSRLGVWSTDGELGFMDEWMPGVEPPSPRLEPPLWVSRNGRQVAGISGDINQLPGLYLAALSRPGEGPRLAARSGPDGLPLFRFRSKLGFTYQVERSGDGVTWQRLGEHMAGNDTWREVSWTGSSEAAARPPMGLIRLRVEAR